MAVSTAGSFGFIKYLYLVINEMIKIWWHFLVLGFGLLIGGCSDSLSPSESGSADPPTLYYYTWSDYVDPEILATFETSRGVRVVVDTFSSNEELLAKVQTGVTGYDVVVPSDFMAGIMGRLGLLAELDLQRIPHVQDLEPHLARLPFDPTQQFAIPYLWGTVGIGYNAEVVAEAPTSWDVLWDPQYSGRISMLNDQREVFGLGAASLGLFFEQSRPSSHSRSQRQAHCAKTFGQSLHE